jgi:surface protein
MFGTFANTPLFNQDLNLWNTSAVTNMQATFRSASSYNLPLTGWNTSNVTNMSFMFRTAINFDSPLGNWDTSKVTTMESMFEFATNFNQELSGFTTTSAVTNMFSMFQRSYSFNKNIGNWDVSNVTGMSQMFYGDSSTPNIFNNNGNPSISGWTTSSLQNTNRMFGYGSFDQPIGSWDMSKVNDMEFMFFENTNFNQDIGSWSIRNSADTKMASLFRETTLFNNGGSSSISGWNVSNIISVNMNNMFLNAVGFNQDLSNWCVSGIPSMPTGFSGGATSWILPQPNWGAPC